MNKGDLDRKKEDVSQSLMYSINRIDHVLFFLFPHA
jgi:hypothetical protein